MQQLKILNTREIKKIKELLQKQFGGNLTKDYVYLLSEKNKIFIVNKDIAKINLNNLKIDRMGLYFAELNKEIRLSQEGAQLLAEGNPLKLKNCIELTKEELKRYFRGEDLEKDLGTEKKLILLQYGQNIFGCAKYKEHKIINFLAKNHRGEVII